MPNLPQKGCSINSTLIAVLVFVFVFGGALAGVAVRVPTRVVRDAETRDVVELVIGLVPTVTALVLSLLMASAHSSYDRQENEKCRNFGAPDCFGSMRCSPATARKQNGSPAQLRRMVGPELAPAVARCWRRTSGHARAANFQAGEEALFATVSRLTPESGGPAICPGPCFCSS